MSSKLRTIYDGLNIGVEMFVLKCSQNRSARKRARQYPMPENFNREFRNIVLPYWRQHGVKPKKYYTQMDNYGHEHLDPRYIPEDIWITKIIPHFNYLIFDEALQDKCLYNLFLPEVKRPETVIKNVAGVYYDDTLELLSEEEVVSRCLTAGGCVIKPSVGSGMGNNVFFYDSTDMDAEKLHALFDRYGNSNFIVQKQLKQHPDLDRIYAGSVNTLRIISFFYKGEVHILLSVLRMGGDGSKVDNLSKGGYACAVRPDGRLSPYAIRKVPGNFDRHSGTGTVFGECVIPGFDKVIATIRREAAKMAHFKIIGWDFAVDENADPVFIEYNVIPGIVSQRASGPIFGDLTDEVLTEVFGKK